MNQSVWSDEETLSKDIGPETVMVTQWHWDVLQCDEVNVQTSVNGAVLQTGLLPKTKLLGKYCWSKNIHHSDGPPNKETVNTIVNLKKTIDDVWLVGSYLEADHKWKL